MWPIAGWRVLVSYLLRAYSAEKRILRRFCWRLLLVFSSDKDLNLSCKDGTLLWKPVFSCPYQRKGTDPTHVAFLLCHLAHFAPHQHCTVDCEPEKGLSTAGRESWVLVWALPFISHVAVGISFPVLGLSFCISNMAVRQDALRGPSRW